nr:uncharacterized protein LOC104102902 [Nicotiana tomentosiformis]
MRQKQKERIWTISRKRGQITCSKYGKTNHNARACDKDPDAEMCSQARKRAACSQTSYAFQSEEELQVTTQQFQQLVFSSQGRTSATQTSDAYPDIGNEEDPLLRPMIISETQTRLQNRMTRQITIETRRIQFKGDHTGTSIPTNLPYSPKKVT